MDFRKIEKHKTLLVIIVTLIILLLIAGLIEKQKQLGLKEGKEQGIAECKKMIAIDYLFSGRERRQSIACKELVYCLNYQEKCIAQGLNNEWLIQKNDQCLGVD